MGKGRRGIFGSGKKEPASLHGNAEGWFWPFWKKFWAVVGPLVSAGVAAFNFIPDVTILPSANVDPAQTFATQFTALNSGRVPINNVRFSCGLQGNMVLIGSLSRGSIEPVSRLGKGQSVTRNCFKQSQDIVGATLAITVSYDWPWLPFTYGGLKTSSFAAVRTVSGFVLVPNDVVH